MAKKKANVSIFASSSLLLILLTCRCNAQGPFQIYRDMKLSALEKEAQALIGKGEPNILFKDSMTDLLLASNTRDLFFECLCHPESLVCDLQYADAGLVIDGAEELIVLEVYHSRETQYSKDVVLNNVTFECESPGYTMGRSVVQDINCVLNRIGGDADIDPSQYPGVSCGSRCVTLKWDQEMKYSNFGSRLIAPGIITCSETNERSEEKNVEDDEIENSNGARRSTVANDTGGSNHNDGDDTQEVDSSSIDEGIFQSITTLQTPIKFEESSIPPQAVNNDSSEEIGGNKSRSIGIQHTDDDFYNDGFSDVKSAINKNNINNNKSNTKGYQMELIITGAVLGFVLLLLVVVLTVCLTGTFSGKRRFKRKHRGRELLDSVNVTLDYAPSYAEDTGQDQAATLALGNPMYQDNGTLKEKRKETFSKLRLTTKDKLAEKDAAETASLGNTTFCIDAGKKSAKQSEPDLQPQKPENEKPKTFVLSPAPKQEILPGELNFGEDLGNGGALPSYPNLCYESEGIKFADTLDTSPDSEVLGAPPDTYNVPDEHIVDTDQHYNEPQESTPNDDTHHTKLDDCTSEPPLANRYSIPSHDTESEPCVLPVEYDLPQDPDITLRATNMDIDNALYNVAGDSNLYNLPYAHDVQTLNFDDNRVSAIYSEISS